MIQVISVFLGGGIGAACRYLLSRYNGSNSEIFPWGTFSANLFSCIVLGVVVSYMSKYNLNTNFKLLVLTGFCGGFSTFSTFSWELFQMMDQGYLGQAAIYFIASTVVSFICIWIGMKLV